MPPPPDLSKRKVVQRFDADHDGRLDAAERKAARSYLAQNPNHPGRPPLPPGSMGPRGKGFPPPPPLRRRGPARPGPKVALSEVTPAALDRPLYDAITLRTLFLQFESADWETELADFWHTDVDLPARLTVDGKTYRDVGVHFRGQSSFAMVPSGYKRSLDLSLDAVHEGQRLGDYSAFHLLNSHGDPTFLRSVLYLTIARDYIPAPKANHVRLVINGESWGVYVNAQPVNKAFVQEWFGTKKGARWKVPGSPGGRGGLDYLGEDVAAYRSIYQLKSREDPRAYRDLIALCKTLSTIPLGELERALEPRLDLDGVLKFLALDTALINGDGYWTRASDYYLYQDLQGLFHIIPHDANETFANPEGPPRAGSTRAEQADLDPLVGMNDPTKPLRSRLLAVPALRERYLAYVRQIAEKWLDWQRLGPLVEAYRARLAPEVKQDTRQLDSYDAYHRGMTEDTEHPGPCGPERRLGLKSFVTLRRAYLLGYRAK
jgi:hypothetical protein